MGLLEEIPSNNHNLTTIQQSTIIHRFHQNIRERDVVVNISKSLSDSNGTRMHSQIRNLRCNDYRQYLSQQNLKEKECGSVNLSPSKVLISDSGIFSKKQTLDHDIKNQKSNRYGFKQKNNRNRQTHFLDPDTPTTNLNLGQ